MKFRIDSSVMTSAGEAVGNVVGDLEFAIAPLVGDTVSLMLAPSGALMPTGHDLGGLLKVCDRVFVLGYANSLPTLMLSDMCADTKAHALEIMRFAEAEFGLQPNIDGE
jgi:hypothetical protein